MSIIQFENLTFSYSGYANAVFDHVSLAFDTSWKTGLIGRNGTGKSTLFKLLMGEEKFEGTLKKSAECLRFPFTVEDPAKPAIEVFYELDPYGEEWKLFRECSLLGLDAELLYRPFETLSKGEQTKVLLAILFTKEFVTPMFEATSKIYIIATSKDSVVDLSDLQIGTNLTSDYIELMYNRPMLEEAIEDLKLDMEPNDLAKLIRVTNPANTRQLNITVASPDPNQAMKISNEIAAQAIK